MSRVGIRVVTPKDSEYRPRSDIVQEARQRIGEARKSKPHFPDLRRIPGMEAEFICSVPHANANVTSWQMFASSVAKEVQRQEGLPEGAVLNFAHDLAVPHIDEPPGYLPELGVGARKTPTEFTLLEKLPPYGYQGFSMLNPKTISMMGIERYLRSNHPEAGEGRIRKILGIMEYWRNATVEGQKRMKGDISRLGIANPTTKALQKIPISDREAAGLTMELLHRPMRNVLSNFRNMQYELFADGEKGFVEERLTSSYLGVIAGVLEMLHKRYGHPFFESPLAGTDFAGKGHLNGIDRNHHRQQVNYWSRRFIFKDVDRTVNIAEGEIYQRMREGIVIPTVPTLVLALTTAPEIPHLGGSSMIKYAPALINKQAEWLGFEDSEKTAGRLLISTNCQAFFTVKDGEHSTTSALAGYLAHGAEAIKHAVRNDLHIENNAQLMAAARG